MNKAQQKRFDSLYHQHLTALKRQGKSKSTIEAYSLAVRRISAYFDRCPDRLTITDLKDYFTSLVNSYSWSTVKCDRNGLQFFYKYVLNKQWSWVEIIKPPQVRSLPDILTPAEISRVINATRELRYQTYFLTVYSMGLRLSEALDLKIGDIDAISERIHIRNGKGRKDRLVSLPKLPLFALRQYWVTHRNPSLLFPAGKTSEQRYSAKTPMHKGAVQQSFKAVVESCHIHKQVSIHNLRHCYGTHLLEQGLNLRAIQKELGHQSLKTTSLYTQLTQTVQQNTLELLNALLGRLTITLKEED